MKVGRIIQIIEKIIFLIGVLYFFLFPIYFLTTTSEFVVYNKIILTVIVACVLLLLWGAKVLLHRKVEVAKTSLDLPFLLIIISFTLSTFFSVSPYTSVFGAFNNWHLTVFEVVAFITILYTLVSNINGFEKIRTLVMAFFSSSFLVGVIGVVVYFDVFDGKTLPQVINFMEILTVNVFSPAGNAPSVIVLLLTAIFLGIFILRWDYLQLRKVEKKRSDHLLSLLTKALMLTPMVLTLIFWLTPYIPGVPAKNPNFTQLNFNASWKVAVSSIREYPLWGTGPSTYSVAYNAYRPAEVNLTDYWDLIFYQSGSEYLTWLTTLGLVGFIALVYLVFKVVRNSIKTLAYTPKASTTKGSASAGAQRFVNEIRMPVVFAILGILIIYLFTSSTTTTMGVLFILLIIWLLIEKETRDDLVSVISFDVKAIQPSTLLSRDDSKGSTNNRKSSSVVPVFVGIPIMIVAVLVAVYSIQDLRSNLAYAKAFKLLNQNVPVRDIYNLEQDAISINPRRDEYRLAYALTNISLAEVIAQNNQESIDDTMRDEVLTLIQQAIREVKIATEVINPYRVPNWQTRSNIYRRLLAVADRANEFAVDAAQTAMNLAPLNPVLRVSMGDLYFLLATSLDQFLPADFGEGSTDPETEKANLRNNYFSQAGAAFRDAIRLKADYATAHFGLARVYAEVQAYDLARYELETTLRLIPPESEGRERVETLLQQVNDLIDAQGDDAGVDQSETQPEPTPTTNGDGGEGGS